MEVRAADWERLHELRLRGFVAVAEGDREWEPLVALGLVAEKGNRVMLTHPGRDAHERWAVARPGSNARFAAERAYDAFGPQNRRLLQVCHDWQVARGGIPNDHRDADYDFKVIERLHRVNTGAVRILSELAPAMPRFATYPDRLADALARVDQGHHQWFASPLCDSYHTVWMQLHEDLLLATGRSRRDEEDAGAP